MENYNEVIKQFAAGRTFKANINGIICEGKIQKGRSEWFLCQDQQDGDYCENKFGYKYSWGVTDNYEEQTTDFEFTDELKKQDPEAWQEGDCLTHPKERSLFILAVTNKNGLIVSESTGLSQVSDSFFSQGYLESIGWKKEKKKVKISRQAIAEKFGFGSDDFEIV